MSGRRIVWALALSGAAVVIFLLFRPPTLPSPRASENAVPKSEAPLAASLEVVVRAGGAPIRGAKVGLAHEDDLLASGVTDVHGVLVLGPLQTGEFRLIVAHPRHLPVERSLGISAGKARVEIDLEPAVAVEIWISDFLRRPVAGAKVRVIASDDRERGHCETGADGKCEVGSLEPGEITLAVVSARHRPGRMTLRLEPQPPVQVQRLTLDEGRVISGRVVDGAGVPLVGAHVGTSDSSGGFATTDAEGRFELLGLGVEPVNIFASAEGFAARHLRGVRTGSANVELRLSAPASVDARVQFASGTRSLMVSVCEFNTHFAKEICVARRAYDPAESDVVLEELPSGTYDVVLEAPGHFAERVRVNLEPGRRTSLGSVRLRPE